MAVWFMRLPCADPVHTVDGIAIAIENSSRRRFTKNSPACRAEIVTDAGGVGTPTHDRRDDVLRTRERAHASTHGGAIG